MATKNPPNALNDAYTAFLDAHRKLRDAIHDDTRHRTGLADSDYNRFMYLTNIVDTNTGSWSGGMRSAENVVETMRHDAALVELRNLRWPK